MLGGREVNLAGCVVGFAVGSFVGGMGMSIAGETLQCMGVAAGRPAPHKEDPNLRPKYFANCTHNTGILLGSKFTAAYLPPTCARTADSYLIQTF